MISFVLILSIALCCFQSFVFVGYVWNLAFPLICLIALVVILKHKGRNRMLANVLIILCLLDFGTVQITKERLQKVDSESKITVMSYNVFFKNQDKAASSKIIQSEQPDILFIQELTPSWKTHLANKLEFKFRKLIPLNGTHGIGVYSNYKLRELTTLKNKSGLPFCQFVELEVDGENILIGNVHLASPAVAVEHRERFISLYLKNYKQRKQELKAINEFIDKHQYETAILVGDFNTMKYEPLMKQQKRRWVNSVPPKWIFNAPNFPNSSKIPPLVSLDYILLKGKVKCTRSKIIKGGSSDHLAIVSEIAI